MSASAEDIGAPFRSVFLEVVDNGTAVKSAEEWRAFVSTLQRRGLVSKNELVTLDRMWGEIQEASVATGKLELTFEEFTDRLLRLYIVPRDKIIKKSIESLTNQGKSLSSLFKEWQIETLNEIQMKQLLLSVDALYEQHERVKSEISQHAEHQVSLMKKQHLQTLFWDEVGGVEAADDARAKRAARTSLQYQQKSSGVIDRTCRKRKLRSIRAVRFPANASTRKDVMGHAAGCKDGVTCTLGNTVVDDGKAFVEVITVPRGPLPSKTLTNILNVYSAHRQLSLCQELPNCLGIDDTSSEDEIYYFYSSSPGGITAAELVAIGGCLKETQPLFRYITGKVLKAFCAIDEMCTFNVSRPLTMQNIIIADVGTQVQIGKIPFADEISPFAKANETKAFHEAREEALVNAFGKILKGLVGESHSPKLDAIVKACFASSGKSAKGKKTFKGSFQEGWERKPALREISAHPLFDISGLSLDEVFVDFEKFIDSAP
jgi:hypothetical protein